MEFIKSSEDETQTMANSDPEKIWGPFSEWPKNEFTPWGVQAPMSENHFKVINMALEGIKLL